MKNKRFWAALLCTAMILTSQSFSVSAAMQEDMPVISDASINNGAIEETEIFTDEAETLNDAREEVGFEEGLLVEDAPVEDHETAVLADEILVNDNEEEIEPVSAGLADEENPEGVEAQELFTYEIDAQGRRVLKLKDGKNIKDKIIKIPVDIDVVPSGMFAGNRKIEAISFAGTVSDGSISSNLIIETGAFKDSTLTSFDAPYNYHTVEAETFSGCNNLKEFEFADIYNIEEKAFYNCSSFGEGTNIGWNGSISRIGRNAFSGTGFINLKLERMVSDNCVISDYAFQGCRELTSVSIPSKVETIPEGCFADCSKLTTIDVAANTNGTKVGKYAFMNCIALTQIGLDSFKVAEIGESAFTGCTKLEKLLFPETVKKVEKNSFENCEKITLIEFHYYNKDKGYAIDFPIIDDYAFPSIDPTKVTMKGYDGKVKEYAEDIAHRFKYASLAPLFSISGQSKKDSQGKEIGFIAYKDIKTNKSQNKARPGEIVELTVSPKVMESSPLWRLRRDSLKDENNGITTDKFEFVKGDDNSQTFKVTMPYNNVSVIAENGLYLDSYIINGKKSGEIGVYKDGKKNYTLVDGVFYTPHPGKMGQLYVNADVSSGAHQGNYKLGQWMFKYKSSDTKIATVTSTGVVTSLAPGDVEITATYRGEGGWSVKFPINVGPAVDINKILVNPDAITPEVGYVLSEETRTFNGKTFNDVRVVTLNEKDMASTARTLDLKLWASPNTDSDKGDYAVKADWVCGDSSIATLTNASTVDNRNILTIKKGAIGNTYVKASYNTHRKDENDKDIILESYLIIRIVDVTPRVTVDDIIVDTNRDEGYNLDSDVTGGTPITVKPIDGYTIDPSSLSMRIGRNRYEAEKKEYTGLKIKNPDQTRDQNYRLIFNPEGQDSGLGTDSAINKSKSYSGTNTLWIYGKQTSDNINYSEFYIPINKVIIQNKPLKLAAKMSGQINLWYNSDCYEAVDTSFVPRIPGCFDELQKNDNETYEEYNKRYMTATIGEVKVENNISYETAEVRNWQLWSEDHYKKWKNKIKDFDDNGSVPATFIDKLQNNFSIDKVQREGTYETDFIIRRTGNHLSPDGVDKKNGREYDVTKGYLAIYFTGYTKPVLQSVTIPTRATAPAYVMSETSILENSRNSGSEFRFRILDKTKKKVMISENSIKNQGTGYDSIYLDKGSIFESLAFDGEDVKFKAKAGLQYGRKTALVNIRRANWEKAAKYKYTVDYVDKIPVQKLNPSTVNLNWSYNRDSVATEVVVNQANCELNIVDIAWDGSDKLEPDSHKITISVSDVKNYKNRKKLTVSFNNIAGGAPQKGTYKFKITSKYVYGTTGKTGDLKPVTLNVKVLVNPPKVRFNTSALTFNMYYPDLENKEVVAAFSNLPVGVDVKDIKIDTSTLSWNFIKSSKDEDIKDEVADCLKVDQTKTHYDLKKKRWMMTFKMDSSKHVSALRDRDFNITYELTNLKVNGTPIAPLRITIKGINREPVVNVSKKGTLNVIDYVTPIQYNTKFSNLTGPMFDGKVPGSRVVVWDLGTGAVSTILKAEQDKDNCNIINVSLIDGAEFKDENYKGYNFQLIYKVNNTASLDITSKPIRLVPVQKVPKIVTYIDKRAKRAEFYSAVNTNNRIVSVDLVKTSQLKTHLFNGQMIGAKYKGVKIKDTNSEVLKSAFTVEYYEPSNEEDLTSAINKYKDLPKNQKRLYAGRIVIKCVNPELLKAGKVYNLEFETEFDGQFYKTDKNGNWVSDSKGEKIKVNGSTFKVPVVVYK